MNKPFGGKISNIQVHDHSLTTREILKVLLKPTGLSKLNPFAWWRWYKVRSYADHVRSLNPIWYSEDEVEVIEDGWMTITEAGVYRPFTKEEK